MSDPAKKEDRDRVAIGPYQRTARDSGPGPAEIVAIVLSSIWLFGASAFFVFLDATGTGFDPLRFVVTLLAIFLPVALIWVAAEAAKGARTMQRETARLEAAIDALRTAYLESQQAPRPTPELERQLKEIAEATKKTETALATFSTIRIATPSVSAPEPAPFDEAGDQPSLALGGPSESMAPPLEAEDLIAALQFPTDANDKEGFRALRRALADPGGPRR